MRTKRMVWLTVLLALAWTACMDNEKTEVQPKTESSATQDLKQDRIGEIGVPIELSGGKFSITVTELKRGIGHEGRPVVTIVYNRENRAKVATTPFENTMLHVSQNGQYLQEDFMPVSNGADKPADVNPGGITEGIEDSFFYTSEEELTIEVKGTADVHDRIRTILTVPFPDE